MNDNILTYGVSGECHASSHKDLGVISSASEAVNCDPQQNQTAKYGQASSQFNPIHRQDNPEPRQNSREGQVASNGSIIADHY
jgi:hypothetical protein